MEIDAVPAGITTGARTPFALMWFEAVLSETGPSRHSTRLVMAIIGFVVRESGSREVRLSINELKARAGMSRTTLMRALLDAADSGWIQHIPDRRRKFKHGRQHYHLTIRLPNELRQIEHNSSNHGFPVERAAGSPA